LPVIQPWTGCECCGYDRLALARRLP
jgi:hypothetical protein